MTADGKIAPASRKFFPFGSKRDREHMLELRSEADAVMSGARTIDQPGVILGTGGKKYRAKRKEFGLSERHARVIVSGSASIPVSADIFRDRSSPILLLASEAAPATRLASLNSVLDGCHISSGESVNFAKAFEWLWKKWGVRRLLCEGGGEINAALFLQGLVDELHLTICPWIYGGHDAPTLADGPGIEKLANAANFRLWKSEIIGNEIFCVYRSRFKKGSQDRL